MATSQKQDQLPITPHTSRESLDETVHRHLSEQGHHITDEQIRDVVPGEITPQPAADGGTYDPVKTKEEALKNISQDDRKGTAWDVLRDGSSTAR